MNISNHNYKIDHRYNSKIPDAVSIRSHPQSKSNVTMITQTFERTAAAAAYNSNIPNTVSIRSQNQSKSNVAMITQVFETAAAHNLTKESSFHNQINNILGKWRQLQEEKKQCQQQQQQQQQQQNQVQKKIKHPESIDFDQIMEEDLANQLEELERQEKEQYKKMEQTIAKQLKVDEHSEQIDQFMHDYIKQLESFEQLNNKGKINELFHRAQNKITHLNIAELKQNLCFRLAINTSNQIKTNKLLDLLKTYYRTKKYSVNHKSK